MNNINEKLISFIALGVSVLALVLAIGIYKKIQVRGENEVNPPFISSQAPLPSPEKFLIIGKVVSWDSAKKQLTIETEQARRYSIALNTIKSFYTAQGSYASLPKDFRFLPDQKAVISVREEADGKRAEFQALSITLLK